MLMQSASYLTDEMIIKKLPFLTPEEAQEVINTRVVEDYAQFNGGTIND